ncbi:MAG: MFS transporter [Candidatus Angelobacter sp. Gp1-AA117]|nr:MAG: MFS transporter [Candidatus Angelobacter sp. Gp1-AA117]
MATQAQAVTSDRFARWSLAVLIAINVLNFYDRHVAGALVEPVRKEFGLSDTQVGWLSTAFTVLYGLIGLPLGWLADKVSRKKLLAVGVTVWAALTASAAWASSYAFLMFSRLGLGVGEAACAPTATSWIGDLYPAHRRSKPLALFMLGVPVGGALSFFFSGPIALRYGWRIAMIMAALPALLLVPVLLLLDEPERGASERGTPPPAGSLWQVLGIPTFWWIVISGALVNFNLYAIGTFLPAFFSRIHHVNVARAGIITGIVYAIGGLIGGVVAGIWGDRVVRRNPSGRMMIAAVAALAAAPLAYFGIHQTFGALAIAIPLLTLTYGLLNMYYGLVYASIQDIVAPSLRATSMAIYFLAMYLGGASWGTVIIGKLSDRWAQRAAALAGSSTVTEPFKAIGLQQAMLAIPILSLALALVLWLGSRSIARDVAKRA